MSTTIFAAPAVTDAAADTSPIVILHTNDVHCGIDDSIGYAGLAAYKSEMEAQYGACLLYTSFRKHLKDPLSHHKKGT